MADLPVHLLLRALRTAGGRARLGLSGGGRAVRVDPHGVGPPARRPQLHLLLVLQPRLDRLDPGPTGDRGAAIDIQPAPVRTGPKIGRNDPCSCGSGKKYKNCCGALT